MDRWIDQFALEKHPSKKYNSKKREQYYERAIQLHFEEGYGEATIAKFIPVGHTTIGRCIILQLLEPFYLTDVHPAVLGLPVVKSCF
jgi:hypothetical protein